MTINDNNEKNNMRRVLAMMDKYSIPNQPTNHVDMIV